MDNIPSHFDSLSAHAARLSPFSAFYSKRKIFKSWVTRQLKLVHAYQSKGTPVSISSWCLNLAVPTDFLSKHLTENESHLAVEYSMGSRRAGSACIIAGMPEAALSMQLWGWEILSDDVCSVPMVKG